jgi:hypothetical protein
VHFVVLALCLEFGRRIIHADLGIPPSHHPARPIVGVTPRMIGRLHFDGAFLLAAPDNNPGGGIEHAPFQVLPSNKAAGATLSVEVDYLSGGSVHSSTYGLVVAMCRGGFTTVACDAISNQAQAFTES